MGIERLFADIDMLREFDPQYVNITTHRSERVYRETAPGLYERVAVRKRPGTVAVAAAIKAHYGLRVVPHILCSGFSREETEYVLIDLQFLGNAYNPNLGAAMSLVLMVFILFCMSITNALDDEDQEAVLL